MEEVRIITNTEWFSEASSDSTKYVFRTVKLNGIRGYIDFITRFIKSDFVLLNLEPKILLFSCVLKLCLPFKLIKIISIDLLLSKPITIPERLLSYVKRFLLMSVNTFVMYMKDTAGYEIFYGLPKEKIVFIPFKVNGYDYIATKEPVEGDYIFTGGASKRDYETLLAAAEGLETKVIILVPPNAVSGAHGTLLNSGKVPKNVSIVHDDGTAKSWIDFVSESKFVVVPVQKDSISATGISTYLVAMALKKCVVITEGPATRDLIPTGAALTVPPANVLELRKALETIDSDPLLRKEIAEKGYRYATALQGQERLCADVFNLLVQLHDNQKGCSKTSPIPVKRDNY